jgi:archaemetzincin
MALTPVSADKFKPPGPEERLAAIGLSPDLPPLLKKAFDPAGCEPVPEPKPGDWLAEHSEPGQTYAEFLKSPRNRPDNTRNAICLLPIGEFSGETAPSLEKLKRYAAAFFGMKVVVAEPLEITLSGLTTRTNRYTRKRQILTDDVLSLLEKKLPADAFCVLGITMEDLYPDPSWNFVFGQASLSERVGVFSFARYDPAFYGETRDKNSKKLVLKRSCEVLAHEAAHMFYLQHCIYFNCAINGSNHLAESDSRPMYACPVCLRKLHSSVGFDLVKRYESLLAFYKEVGFDKEAAWAAGRLKAIGAAQKPE